ncbi:hypothetical protein [Bradyrhizobium sp. S3.9.1]|uniref:hypothetical protein n=1 Tax=Bradyrhizobium sp. S3.9.1 TaxID=3156431 RepID=UPI003395149E
MTRATLQALAIIALLNSPAAKAQSVVAVRPSGPTVPANLLRFSIVFSTAPSNVGVQDFVLQQASGSLIVAPFDPLELWSPDRRVLTILFQPGRVKTGLIAHNTLGWALVPGTDVVLLFRGHAITSWRVTAPINSPPDPTHWLVKAPGSHTNDPITVRLGAGIDALDKDLVAVADAADRRVPGHATLAQDETVWRFAPSRPWQPGFYSIKINPSLEDPAGNRVRQNFEHRSKPDAPMDTPHLRIHIQ